MFRTLVAGTAVLGLAVIGCSDSDNPVASAPETARVLIVHASPDAPGVDIYIDGAAPAAVTDLEFLANTGYVSLPAGRRNVRVKVSATADTVINADLVLDPNKNYSVFAVDSAVRIAPLVLADDLTVPAAGKAHLRFVHLSPNAPNVDIALAAGPVIGGLGDVAFKESRGFLPLDAGVYNLEVRPAGQPTVVLSLNGVDLMAGKIYTVYAKGFAGGTGVQALGAQIIVNN